VIAVPGGRLNGTVGFWTSGARARGDPSPAADENMQGLNMQYAELPAKVFVFI